MAKTISPKDMLDLPMLENDANAATFRDYFKALLNNAMHEIHFDAKRPFGDSNWRNELHESLIWNQVAEYNVIDGLTHDQRVHLDRIIWEMVQAL